MFVAEQDSGLGMVYSSDFYVATAIREWFRNHYQARLGFRQAQREYLEDIHCRLGGYPLVVFPNQRTEDAQAHVPQAWTILQRVLDYVGLPLWLPGPCA